MVVGANKDDDNALNSGAAYVYIRQSGAWSRVAKLTAFDGASEDGFGFSVAVEGDTVVVGAYQDDDNGVDSGSAYLFTKPNTGWADATETAKLTAFDGAADDYFGFSVAVDGETVVVGAYQDDDDGLNSGSAYLFTKPADGWATDTETAKLTASYGTTGDNFGISVAVEGDTVVVGAWWADDEKGSAYLFTKPPAGWTTANETAKLTASDRTADDYFGRSVAVDGDTVIVGASKENDNGDDSGSAYLFTKPADGWTTANETAKLTASDGAADDEFGFSVAVDGDTVVVGALYDDDNGEDSGSAYLFTKPAGGWASTSTAAKLTASDGASDDWFGRSVGVDGDTVVVGAHQDDDKGGNSGSAYVYEVSDWTAVPDSGPGATNATSYTVTGLTNGAEYDFRIRAVNSFGKGAASDIVPVKPINIAPMAADDTTATPEDTAVDINVTANDTDTDGDTLSVTSVTSPSNGTAAIAEGSTTTVTYTPGADFTGTDSFDYTLSDGTDTDTGAVTITVTPVDDAPAAVDDIATTARDTAVDINVTANDTDPDSGASLSVTSVTSPSNGTAVITSGSTTTVTYTPNVGYTGTDSFDYTLSDGTGTGTDTGTATVTVGTPRKPAGLTATAGGARATLTWDDPSDGSITRYDYLKAQAAKLTASDGAAEDELGYSVAVDGDTAVVGAHGDNGDQGAAYVLTRQSGVWGQVAKLTASDGAALDHFGISVEVDGDTVVVGSVFDDSMKGSAYVFKKPNGGWADATETAKLTASDRSLGDQFGQSVAVDGDTVVVGAYNDDDGGENDSGSAYVFTEPNGGWADATETAKLTALVPDEDDYFGYSVAMDGDTVVVGAYQADGFEGSAYVFTKPTNDGWADATETAKLTASDGFFVDSLGYSVAVDGDTVVAGAYGDDGAQGSTYVYTEPNGGWADATETAKLTASNEHNSDLLGFSVAVEGDTVVAGAHGYDENGSSSGSIYVFNEPTSGGWADATETARLSASDGAADDLFGWSVAVDGDSVMVGAKWDDDNGSKSGSAYLYEVSDWTAVPGSGAGDTNATSYTVTRLTNDAEYDFRIRATNNVGTGPTSDAVTVILALPSKPTGLTATSGNTQAALAWGDPSDSGITGYDYLLHRELAKLTPIDGAAGDNFGWSVAVDGDTAVVGAYRDDNVKGAVYVLTSQSGTWSEVAKLTASDGDAGDHFGYSVAMNGDTVLVGATANDGNTSGSGAAYLFIKPNGGWVTATQTAKLTAYDGATADSFGHAVAMDGDTVVVGAYRDDDNGAGSGSAYVFTKPSDGWADATETAKLTASDGAAGEYFGLPVAVSGDTVVVSAHGDIDDRGAVYVFTKPSDGWATAAGTVKLTAFDGADDDDFGISVAVDGDTVAVGAWYDDDNGFNSGSVYVFTEPSSGGWTTTTEAAKLTASDGAANDQFGVSVAVDGEKLVVGAYRTDSFKGSAYVFTKPGNGWAAATETARLNASDRAASDNFGLSVAVGGDTVVVGAPYDDDNGAGSGSVYLYEVSDSTAIPSSAAGETNATSYTVTGLTNDEEYSFLIRAKNTIGASPASDAVHVTPANTAPTAVADTAVTAEDTAVDINLVANDTDPDAGDTLSVTAVATPSNGTAAIASGSTTTVTYTPDADFTGTDSFEYTLSDGTDTDTGTVTVTVGPAGNVSGQGGTPAEPTGLVGTPGDGQLALAWTDPGNSTITKYQYSTDGGTTFTDIPGSNATTISYTVTGLSSGTEYTIAVRAVNVNGNGAAATVTATTLWPAPENLVAAPDSTRVVLQWDTGDAGITNYLVRSHAEGSGGDPEEKVVAAGSGTRTTAEVTSLTDGTEYAFSVRAAEVSGGETVVTGLGTTVTETPTVAVPAVPANLTATPGDGQVAVTWDDPGNITIRKYQYSTNGGSSFNHMNGSKRNTTSFTFNNLTTGTEYTLAIRASNLSGESTAATVTATAGWPAPTNVVATPSNNRVKLEWDTGDPGIANYVSRLEVTGSGNYFYTILAAGNGATTSYTHTNLNNGTEYTLTVGAGELDSNNNAAFTGQTVTVTATTPWPAPENLVAAPDSTRVVLQWDTGGSGVTNYLVRSQAEGSGGDPAEKVVAPGSGTKTTTEVTGLTNGTAYVFSVRAAEVSGGETVVTGMGATVTETPTAAVPATPANLTATPGRRTGPGYLGQSGQHHNHWVQVQDCERLVLQRHKRQ